MSIIEKIKDWWECVKLDVVWLYYDIRHALKWIKWGWQRARRGYSDWDACNFDEYLMKLITNVLKYYIRDYCLDDKIKTDMERIIELCEHYDDPNGAFWDENKRKELIALLTKNITHWWI